MIITIDGPAGAGKTTVARLLAARLGVPYLDTGAMYRVVTLAALQASVDLNDEAALVRIATHSDWDLELAADAIRVMLAGRDVSDEIRTMWVNDNTRYIAGSPGVRRLMIEKQRAIAERVGSLVTEGRDQGTAAFPAADLKFFLAADLNTRAGRRLAELRESDEISLTAVRDNLAQRDHTDAARPVAPLVKPPDAIEIDTSQMPAEDVVAAMITHVQQANLAPHERSP